MAEWQDIPGYVGLYRVSEDGLVLSLERTDRLGRPVRQRTLKPQMIGPYWCVHLWKDGKERVYGVHELVAAAFIGTRPGGQECRHKDGQHLNNHYTNLLYGTRSDNALDSVRHGTHNMARKEKCKNGHLLSGDNLHMGPKGQRICKTCRRSYGQAYRQRRAA